jgi:periplasmic mercuric ion binding protein
MKILKLLPAIALAGFATQSFAETKTVALDVPSMYCEACPITVKKALSRVPGVSNVAVSFLKKEAVVTFDDAKASVGSLTQATANAGFPSKPKP